MNWSEYLEVADFAMQHHRDNLAAGVLADVQHWLEPQLIERGFSFLDGQISGRFGSRYDEELYFGPNSLVKNSYELEVQFRPNDADASDSQFDEVRLHFDWVPQADPPIKPVAYHPDFRKWEPPPPEVEPDPAAVAAETARQDALDRDAENAPLEQAAVLDFKQVRYNTVDTAVQVVEFGSVTCSEGLLTLGQFGDFDSPEYLSCSPGEYVVTTLFPKQQWYPACYTLIAQAGFQARSWQHLPFPFQESQWEYFATDPRSLMLMDAPFADTYLEYYESTIDDPDDEFHDNFAYGCHQAPEEPNNRFLQDNEAATSWRINRHAGDIVTFLCGGVAQVFGCSSGRRDGFLLKW